MGAAAAQIWLHPAADFGISGRRVAVEQRLRAHYHAGDAIAALRRLLIDEGLLQRARLVFRAKPFDRRDRPVLHRDDRQQAGVDWFASDNDGAGTALAEAATEFRTVEGELAAQRVKQRRRRVDVELVRCPVDDKRDHERSLLCRMLRTVRSRSVQAGPAL